MELKGARMCHSLQRQISPYTHPPSTSGWIYRQRMVRFRVLYLVLILTTPATAVTGETRKLDISWPSQEFYDICRHSPGYNEDNMNVSIKHIRKYDCLAQCLEWSNFCPRWACYSYELPDDVFYDGQTRPTKPAKKTKKRVHATMDSGDSVRLPISTFDIL